MIRTQYYAKYFRSGLAYLLGTLPFHPVGSNLACIDTWIHYWRFCTKHSDQDKHRHWRHNYLHKKAGLAWTSKCRWGDYFAMTTRAWYKRPNAPLVASLFTEDIQRCLCVVLFAFLILHCYNIAVSSPYSTATRYQLVA